MHTEKARLPPLGDEVCAADVGGQHGLLNQAVRLGARARHDLLDAAVVVADDLCLRGLEVHRTTLLARCQQRPVHVGQVDQVLHALLTPLCLWATRIGQDGRHLGIGEARMAVHDGGVKLVGRDFALAADQHVADHAQAINLWVERTQAVAELLRQHRDDAARKVHAGGAVVGVHINRAACLHVMAHVSNGHQQAPAFAAPHLGGLAVDRVIEVAGIFPVDGDERDVGEVHAALLVLRAHLVG